MTGTREALQRAASTDTARRAADTAAELREELGELASDVSRKVGKEFARAKNIATDVGAANELSDLSRTVHDR